MYVSPTSLSTRSQQWCVQDVAVVDQQVSAIVCPRCYSLVLKEWRTQNDACILMYRGDRGYLLFSEDFFPSFCTWSFFSSFFFSSRPDSIQPRGIGNGVPDCVVVKQEIFAVRCRGCRSRGVGGSVSSNRSKVPVFNQEVLAMVCPELVIFNERS